MKKFRKNISRQKRAINKRKNNLSNLKLIKLRFIQNKNYNCSSIISPEIRKILLKKYEYGDHRAVWI